MDYSTELKEINKKLISIFSCGELSPEVELLRARAKELRKLIKEQESNESQR